MYMPNGPSDGDLRPQVMSETEKVSA